MTIRVAFVLLVLGACCQHLFPRVVPVLAVALGGLVLGVEVLHMRRARRGRREPGPRR